MAIDGWFEKWPWSQSRNRVSTLPSLPNISGTWALPMGRAPILFVHIPKTAGTSLGALLRTRFDRSEVLEINDGWQDYEQLRAKVDQYRLVMGHVGIGLQSSFGHPPDVVTFLRDPIERAISAFAHLQREKVAEFSRYTDADGAAQDVIAAKRLSLLEFIERHPKSAATHMGNVQTWSLAGHSDRRLQPGAADLDSACRTLERCVCVGLVERPDESLTLLCRALRWPPFPKLPRANAAPRRPAASDLDQPTIEALRSFTAIDSELYRFARELFEQRWRVCVASPSSLNDRPIEEPAPLQVPGPGETTTFTFDRAIPGHGWYGSDRMGESWASWTGPDCTSWIKLNAYPQSPMWIRVHVAHALKAEIIHGTKLFINDRLLAAKVHRDSKGHVLEALVPKMPDQSGSARILFQVPQVLRPCDLSPAYVDTRTVGLAVSGIALTHAD